MALSWPLPPPLVPFRDAEGKITKWFGTNTDVELQRGVLNRNRGSVRNVWSAVELQGKSVGRETCLRKCIRPFIGNQISWP